MTPFPLYYFHGKSRIVVRYKKSGLRETATTKASRDFLLFMVFLSLVRDHCSARKEQSRSNGNNNLLEGGTTMDVLLIKVARATPILIFSSLPISYRLHPSFRMSHFTQFARDLFLRKVLLEFALWFLASVAGSVTVVSMSSTHRQFVILPWVVAYALLWATVALRHRDKLNDERHKRQSQDPELQPTRPQSTDHDLAEVYDLYSVLPFSVEDGDNRENGEG